MCESGFLLNRVVCTCRCLAKHLLSVMAPPPPVLPDGAEAEETETAEKSGYWMKESNQLVTITNYSPGLHLHESSENSFCWESLFIPSFNKCILERE